MVAFVLVDGALSSQGEKVVQERLEVPLVVGLGGPASREGRAVRHVPSPIAVLAHREEGPHVVPRAPQRYHVVVGTIAVRPSLVLYRKFGPIISFWADLLQRQALEGGDPRRPRGLGDVHEAERTVGVQLADAIVRRRRQGVMRPRPRRRAPRFVSVVDGDAIGAEPEQQTRPVSRAFHLGDTACTKGCKYVYHHGGNSRGPEKNEGGQAPPSLASCSWGFDSSPCTTIYVYISSALAAT
mmetsp:Transcript_4540/g.10921  ORF Transcript_4540/g.10921 Transcript_4540/m.10921 type:complete len:240 (+) Transcript_4540:620-1339(+)